MFTKTYIRKKYYLKTHKNKYVVYASQYLTNPFSEPEKKVSIIYLIISSILNRKGTFNKEKLCYL